MTSSPETASRRTFQEVWRLGSLSIVGLILGKRQSWPLLLKPVLIVGPHHLHQNHLESLTENADSTSQPGPTESGPLAVQLQNPHYFQQAPQEHGGFLSHSHKQRTETPNSSLGNPQSASPRSVHQHRLVPEKTSFIWSDVSLGPNSRLLEE